MKSCKDYNKTERKGKALAILIILLAVVIGLAWNAIEARNDPLAWEATESYPMANANITYTTMLFTGGWD